MTMLLVVVLGFLAAYAIYLATLSARHSARPEDHLDGGGHLPAWTYVFGGTGIVLASLGLHDHFLLVSLYGLQYSHVALGLILVALCGALVQKRVWLAARITGVRSPVELFGAYYGSVTLRLFMLGVLLLFALPFAASSLSMLGDLVQGATGGALVAGAVVWISAFFLFLFSALGGWRAVVYVVAAQSFLVLVLMVFAGAFPAASFDALAFLRSGIAAPNGTLADKIPGVLQYTSGLGKDAVVGGVWTTVGILSFALSLIGTVLSPGFAFLGTTTATRTGFAFSQVWMTAGLAGGLLLLVAPVIGAEIAGADSAALAAGAPSYAALAARFAALDPLAGIAFLLLLVCSLQIAVAFFVSAGANILALDLVARYVLPDLSGAGRRLAARVTLALLYAAVALLASFAPLSAALAGSVTLSLSAQLLPAFLGLCWMPWLSRSAVLVGLIVGSPLVLFTEPAGLVPFEGLFVDLPWGRWPLTVHSAAWGLVFNLLACLLVAIFTRGGEEREHRQRLHDAFRHGFRADFGRRAAREAKWSLTLIWAFLALGPGAILGNDFFSHPMFSDTEASLGVPSLWVWQVVFWFLGVLLVWWLAYGGRLSVIDAGVSRTLDLAPAVGPLQRRRPPHWIALLLARVAERERR
jgi:SSS family solute:Na+ symporter